ncbi:LTV-domain-containing protein [Sistotremastrum suecicum HHB10207 ss-3]|uniref:LTV-domain-containing protein n=1 Tax=Sistotremastrum suecicum HHB10207 ss-3 TaxID=1314776 RepID=A0A166EKD4_9AGAM|nr:LTV-domain-containing protein [Sistotremastrum suecicum HHB10207 ss-3]
MPEKTKSKSLFRQPGAKHFQLVHRSQRDPLIHDPEASQHVLKAFVRGNKGKGKTRDDLEALIDPSDLQATRPNVGEASLYGVYYDDTDYDYMQHLRPVGIQEEGVDSIWIDAPSTSSNSKSKSKKFSEDMILPPSVLPSKTELPLSSIHAAQSAIPPSLQGLQPDMDPHLRQVLEALEDEAFVDDDPEATADDFFGELVADGERDSDEEVEFEFQEWGVGSDEEHGLDEDADEDAEGQESADWEDRFRKFKAEQKQKGGVVDDGSVVDGYSEGGDTLSGLPKLAVAGGKRRRTGTTDGSGYSLSSSAVYRNAGLTTLDEQFDRLMAKEYGEVLDDDEYDDGDSVSHSSRAPDDSDDSDDSEETPDLLSRPDLQASMSDFLDNYEIIGGRKLRQVMPGMTGADKLETLRRGMASAADKERILAEAERIEREDMERKVNQNEMVGYDEDEDKKDRWDCETILSTYSNLENHPKLIRVRDGAVRPPRGPKIVVDRKTGFPSVVEEDQKEVEDSEDSDDTTKRKCANLFVQGGMLILPVKAVRETIKRPKGESKEDKKARKAAVKAERQVRRVEKKAMKSTFEDEKRSFVKVLNGRRGVEGVKKL